MASSNGHLDILYPLPSPPISVLCPGHLVGVSRESKVTVTKVLKDSHQRWHAFVNDLGSHNHTSHHLLAAYSLGASSSLIEAVYQRHVPTMRAACRSPEAVIEENVFHHIGQMNFYDSYLAFFSSKLLEKGANATQYFFSNKANIEASAPGKEPPWMLTRFLGDLLHPLIHDGYGLEFGLFGQLAEGLAQAAVHPADGILLPVCIIQ